MTTVVHTTEIHLVKFVRVMTSMQYGDADNNEESWLMLTAGL